MLQQPFWKKAFEKFLLERLLARFKCVGKELAAGETGEQVQQVNYWPITNQGDIYCLSSPVTHTRTQRELRGEEEPEIIMQIQPDQ